MPVKFCLCMIPTVIEPILIIIIESGLDRYDVGDRGAFVFHRVSSRERERES
jgi:hypothetical protein